MHSSDSYQTLKRHIRGSPAIFLARFNQIGPVVVEKRRSQTDTHTHTHTQIAGIIDRCIDRLFGKVYDKCVSGGVKDCFYVRTVVVKREMILLPLL